MKNKLLFFYLFGTLIFKAFPQTPNKIWDKTFGGNSTERQSSIISTSDGGFIIAGESSSNTSGDKTENSKGGFDIWVVKVNSEGQKEWDKTLGGNSSEGQPTIASTDDGGFIIAAYSDSNISGDKSENGKGGTDFWVIRLNNLGQKIWDKTIGGNSNEYRPTITKTNDGGFVIAGYSYSNISGDKSENSRGNSDYWVVKLNENGQKVWDKTYGGNLGELQATIVTLPDNSYIVAGYSESNISGDKSENTKGGTDYWILKLNSSGQKLWDKTIGGNNEEYRPVIISTNDDNLLISGYSNSNISGDKTENSFGDYDYWVIKLNNNGEKIWDKTFGGSLYENSNSVINSQDNGYIIAGYSNSNISGNKSENNKGGYDYWIIKVSSNGLIEWDKTLGGGNNERIPSIATSATDTFVIAGESNSNNSADKTENSKGGYDYWLVKLSINNIQSSIKNGNWNDPSVWSNGTIPDQSQEIIIKEGHIVTITNEIGMQKCKKLIIENGGILQNNGALLIQK
jgi:hypothetical protein